MARSAINKSTNSDKMPALLRGKIINKSKKAVAHTQVPKHKPLLNQATRELKQLLYEHKNMQLQHYLSNLNPMETTEQATKNKIKSFQKQNSPIRIEDGMWAKSNEEKAMAFTKHLKAVFQQHFAVSNDDISDFLNTPYQLELPLDKFKVNQITHIINTKLNSRKSTGYDLITARILKELPISALRFLTAIYNAAGHFPSQWKVAVIILIPKPGKPPELIESYGPISLLPIMSKLLEKLLFQ
jgi:hypothetical protein